MEFSTLSTIKAVLKRLSDVELHERIQLINEIKLELQKYSPFASRAPLGDDFRTGIGEVSHLAEKDAQRLILASILLRKGSLFATNGFVMLEYWHGFSMPVLTVPKVFATALSSTSKPIIGFGFSDNSFTVWFDDESWLKTQLFAEQWPEIDHILQTSSEYVETPKNFYEGLRIIEDFSKDNTVVMNEKGFQSGDSVYELKGLPEGRFNIKYLKQVHKSISQFAFDGKCLFCFGGKMRGAVMGMRVPEQVTYSENRMA